MKAIAKKLMSTSESIRKRIKSDVSRANSYKSCKKLKANEIYGRSVKVLKAVKERTTANIIRSVLVCDTDCLTVSFEREIEDIRDELSQIAGESQSLAKKVVACSKVKKTSGSSKPGSRTDQELEKIIKETRKIVSNCKVCK